MDVSSVSQKVAAEVLGVTPRTVRDWAAEQLPRNDDGTYSLPACVAWLIQRSSGGELDLEQERARLAKAQADKTELDLEARRGELLEVAVVKRVWTDLITPVRARFLGMPTKLAPELAAMTDPGRVRARLHDEVYEVLTEVSNYQPGAAARQQREGLIDGEQSKNRATASASA